MTPNARRLRDAIAAEFPTATFGVTNCRHIASNRLRPWSQHAEGNALDIWSSVPTLDDINQWIIDRRQQYDVNNLLWRVKNHHDHIHVDFWPKLYDRFWYKPPCKGGTLKVVHRDGMIGNVWPEVEDDVPQFTDEEAQVLKDIVASLTNGANPPSSGFFAEQAVKLIRRERDKPLHLHEDDDHKHIPGGVA